MSKEHIGDYLRNQLDRKGISQTELVTLLGVTRQTINKHINDGSRFDLKNYIKLSEILDVTLDDLIYGGKGRPTELRRFAQKPIDRINVNKVPEQPDGLGNTLLDYVIEMNSVPKFKLFFDNNCFIETVHNNSNVLSFLIKNNQCELLKGRVVNTVVDSISNSTDRYNGYFEFPPINFMLKMDGELFERNNHPFHHLNKEQKIIADAILNTNSKEIMELIPYKGKEGKNKLPSLFYWSQFVDKLFVYKYYIELYNVDLTQERFNSAIRKNATKIAKYIFENMEYKTIENLRKIKDTKYKKVWKEKLGYK